MIIVQIVGGIGNQLFQYAFGKYLSEKYEHKVVYDLRYFSDKRSKRKCELKIFDSNLPEYKNRLFTFEKYSNVSFKIWKLFFVLHPNNVYVDECKFVDDPFFFVKFKKKYYLQGYWQSKRYVEYLSPSSLFHNLQFNIENELIKFSDAIKSEIESVCVHVRRGDYFSPQFVDIYGVCDIMYFQSAIDYLMVRMDNPVLFIFSDDLEWVKNNLELPSSSVFIDNYQVNQFSYIYLMSLCKHNIISNSSFSWWGAFLNFNKDKIVISPSKWTLISTQTLALDEWVKL